MLIKMSRRVWKLEVVPRRKEGPPETAKCSPHNLPPSLVVSFPTECYFFQWRMGNLAWSTRTRTDNAKERLEHMHKYFLWSSCPTFADVSGLQAAFYPFKYFIRECTHFCLILKNIPSLKWNTTINDVSHRIPTNKTQNPKPKTLLLHFIFTMNFIFQIMWSFTTDCYL